MKRRRTLSLAFLLGVALAASGRLYADKPVAAVMAEESSPESDAAAPVVVDGKTIFKVHGISAYPAPERALRIEQRIMALARDVSISTSALRVVPDQGFNRIDAASHFLMNVYDRDVEGVGASRLEYAALLQSSINRAVVSYRELRRPFALGIRLAQAVLIVVVCLVIFGGLSRLERWIDGVFSRRIRAQLSVLQSKSFNLIQAEKLHAVPMALFRFVRMMASGVVALFGLQWILGLFPWTVGVSRQLLTYLMAPIETIGATAIAKIPDLLFLTVLGVAVSYVLKLVGLFFQGIASGSIRLGTFDPDWALPTQRIVRVLVVVFALVVAYPYIPGSGSGAFKGISIFLGVLFSLGSSSFIANILAGYSVIYRRAFKVGDRIKVNDVVGEVEDIGMMVTRLRSLKNEEVVIPNSSILSNNVFNFSHHAQEGRLILHTTAGIGYETPWRQVEAMLLMAAGLLEGMPKERPPFVLIRSLGDFAVVYEINVYWNSSATIQAAYSALHKHILDVFNEYGIQIMTPAYEQDPAQPKIVPKDQWFATPAKRE